LAASIISLIEVLRNPFRENNLRDSWIILSLRLTTHILYEEGKAKRQTGRSDIFYHMLDTLSTLGCQVGVAGFDVVW